MLEKTKTRQKSFTFKQILNDPILSDQLMVIIKALKSCSVELSTYTTNLAGVDYLITAPTKKH